MHSAWKYDNQNIIIAAENILNSFKKVISKNKELETKPPESAGGERDGRESLIKGKNPTRQIPEKTK